MYRLTYIEYSPHESGMRTMTSEKTYLEFRATQTRYMEVKASNDEGARVEVKRFLESSRAENRSKFGASKPHEFVELVRIIPLAE